MIARIGVVPPFILLDGPPRQLLRPLARIQRRVHSLRKLISSVDVTSSNDVARPRSLFDAAEVVHTFSVEDDARYASILQTTSGIYAVVKRGSLSTQKDGEVQHLSMDCDASRGVSCDSLDQYPGNYLMTSPRTIGDCSPIAGVHKHSLTPTTWATTPRAAAPR